jgi:hypothetical protein
MGCPNASFNAVLDSANSYEIALRPLSWFRQSEHVDPGNVKFLAETIVRAGHWLEPIIVEKSCGIVMDGNHRLNAAMELGLKRVPCIQLEYGDPRVCVRHWRTGYHFEVAHIFRTIAQGEIFPYKTTRHEFNPALPVISVPLGALYS